MTFDSDDGMKKKWNAFEKKIDITIVDFQVILRMIKCFLMEPFTAVIEKGEFEKEWDAELLCWK